jgi:hypothetical protein
VSGLVLSALALVATTPTITEQPPRNANLLPAQFGAPVAPPTNTFQVVPTPSFKSTPFPARLASIR